MKLSSIIDKKFEEAIDAIQEQEIPATVSWAFVGVLKKVRDERARYEEVRKNLLNKYGSKRSDGSLDINPTSGNINFTQENLKKFMAEMKQLLDIDVSFEQVKLSALGDKVVIKPKHLLALDGIIVK